MGLLHAGLKRLARDADLLTAPVSSVEQLLQPDSQNKHRATTLVKLDMRELSQRFAAVYEPGGCMSQKYLCTYLCSTLSRTGKGQEATSLHGQRSTANDWFKGPFAAERPCTSLPLPSHRTSCCWTLPDSCSSLLQSSKSYARFTAHSIIRWYVALCNDRLLLSQLLPNMLR